MSGRLDDVKGPYVRLTDEGYEGWQAVSFPTLKEALEAPRYSGNSFVIMKVVHYDVVENDAL